MSNTELDRLFSWYVRDQEIVYWICRAGWKKYSVVIVPLDMRVLDRTNNIKTSIPNSFTNIGSKSILQKIMTILGIITPIVEIEMSPHEIAGLFKAIQQLKNNENEDEFDFAILTMNAFPKRLVFQKSSLNKIASKFKKWLN